MSRSDFTAKERESMRVVEKMLEEGRVNLLVDRWSGGALRFLPPRLARLYKHAVKKSLRAASPS